MYRQFLINKKTQSLVLQEPMDGVVCDFQHLAKATHATVS